MAKSSWASVIVIYEVNLAKNALFISFIFVKARVSIEGFVTDFAFLRLHVIHAVGLIASSAFY